MSTGVSKAVGHAGVALIGGFVSAINEVVRMVAEERRFIVREKLPRYSRPY